MKLSAYLSISAIPASLCALISVGLSLPANASEACPSWLDHNFRQLHSSQVISLCEKAKGKPLLLVNTASHCGFTHQFSGLEKIHQRYKDKGLVVIGFASNDFNQAAKTEAKAASICYKNYGVSFTMMAPISVTGDKAHPLFQHLASQAQEPSWNFNKFLVDTRGQVVKHFGAGTAPTRAVFTDSIEKLL